MGYKIFKAKLLSQFLKCSSSGADLGFSRGGGADFQKIFENFDFF